MRAKTAHSLLVQVDLKDHLRRIEVDFIEKYLQLTRGNKTLAAKLLGMSRPLLIYKLQIHHMDQWFKSKKRAKQ